MAKKPIKQKDITCSCCGITQPFNSDLLIRNAPASYHDNSSNYFCKDRDACLKRKSKKSKINKKSLC